MGHRPSCVPVVLRYASRFSVNVRVKSSCAVKQNSRGCAALAADFAAGKCTRTLHRSHMSIADELMSTATAVAKAKMDLAVQLVVTDFKSSCSSAAKEGAFNKEMQYNLKCSASAESGPLISSSGCVYVHTSMSVAIEGDSSPRSLKLSVEWKPKQSGEGKPGVKREYDTPEAGGQAKRAKA
eukprot:6332125-Prymnesium_polylepis.1